MQPPALSSSHFCQGRRLCDQSIFGFACEDEWRAEFGRNSGDSFFFLGRLGLSFDVNSYSAVELGVSAKGFSDVLNSDVCMKQDIVPTGRFSCFRTMPMPFMRICSFHHHAFLFLSLLALHVNSQQQEKAWEFRSQSYLFQVFLNMPVKKAL